MIIDAVYESNPGDLAEGLGEIVSGFIELGAGEGGIAAKLNESVKLADHGSYASSIAYHMSESDLSNYSSQDMIDLADAAEELSTDFEGSESEREGFEELKKVALEKADEVNWGVCFSG